MGLTQGAAIEHGHYYCSIVLMHNANKVLVRIPKDTVKGKLSYSDIPQPITLHMTPNLEFKMPLRGNWEPY